MAEPELTFLYGESVPRCTHHIDKHFVGYNTLQYMSAGSVELHIGARRWVLEGRWFWSAWAGPRIRFHVGPGQKTWRHRYVAFRGPLVGRWMSEGLFPIDPQRSPGDMDYGRRFDQLLAEAMGGEKWSARRATHLLEGILIELAEDRSRRSPEPAWLRRALDRLTAAACGQAIAYGELADAMGMAPSTLRRRFRAAVGVAPHEFVLQARVAEAKRLLGESELPIKAIAMRLGYRDVYFFSRQFRRLAGVPPGVYRRSRQG